MFDFTTEGPDGTPELPAHLTINDVQEWHRTVVLPLSRDLNGGCSPVLGVIEQMTAVVHTMGDEASALMVADLDGRVCPGCFAQMKAAHTIVTTALTMLYPNGRQSAIVRAAEAILTDGL